MTAPFGFYPAHSPCLMGTPKSQGNGAHAGSVRASFWGPLGPAVPAGKTRRAAHKDVRRFRPGQEAPSENSRRDCAPAACGGRTAGGCFFCLLFFAQAKKSRAFAASGAMFDLPQTHSEGFNRNARSQ